MDGVLLCNLGTPDAPTPRAVRRFLAEFLWDPRVVEIPRPIWWLILNGLILRTRPSEVAHKYRQIWTDAGSPLRAIGELQALGLQQAFDADTARKVRVELAMRYGEPSIARGLRALRDAGASRVLVLPLYPQYSASTTASVFDAVSDELRCWRRLPGLSIVRDYHDDPVYIAALASSVIEYRTANGSSELLMMSFHGVPERYLGNGDTYFAECQRTARLLADALELRDDDWAITFQSRFGREEWVKPYTDVTLKEWAHAGVRRVDVVCPGFAADCLETLEEIAIQNRQLFIDAGGDELKYIPALNDRPDHISLLHGIAARHLC
ncbi:MAG: ferrochelatase [Gammaproteobacteria bacterium]